MMYEIQNIPQLRFHDFKGEWEKKTLSEISSKITDGTHDTPKPTKQGVPFLTAIHIKDGFVDYNNCYFLDKEVHNSIYKRCNPEKDDLLIVNIGAGTATCAINSVDYEFSLKNVALVKPNQDLVNGKFLAQIQRKKSSKIFNQLTSGGAQPFLSLKEIGRLKISFPTLPEQQKIASFLSAVDEKIQQLSRKKELLSQYKKGVMQQLFSGKLRFKDENGEDYADWEEKKLGEVTSYKKGFAFKSKDYQNSGVRIIRVSDLLSSSIKVDNEKVFISSEKAEIYDKYKLNKGNIIITTVGSKPDMLESAVGRGIIMHNENEGLLNQNMLKFENIRGVDNRFLINMINTKRYQYFLKDIARGNANQANITVVDLLNYKIVMPSFLEQQKIANFLSSIDEKIESTSHQLNQTQSFKKGLLQQLFV